MNHVLLFFIAIFTNTHTGLKHKCDDGHKGKERNQTHTGFVYLVLITAKNWVEMFNEPRRQRIGGIP